MAATMILVDTLIIVAIVIAALVALITRPRKDP